MSRYQHINEEYNHGLQPKGEKLPKRMVIQKDGVTIAYPHKGGWWFKNVADVNELINIADLVERVGEDSIHKVDKGEWLFTNRDAIEEHALHIRKIRKEHVTALKEIETKYNHYKARADLFDVLVKGLDRGMRIALQDSSNNPRSYSCPDYPSQHSPGNPDQYCSEGTCGWFKECEALVKARKLTEGK